MTEFETNCLSCAAKLMTEVIGFTSPRNIDDRGEFSRIYDFKEINSPYFNNGASQISFSYNKLQNTRRGLHVRVENPLEYKLVRPIQGSIFDVVLDCRQNSKSFGTWISFVLKSDLGDGICVPGGFAHGIQTLEDQTIVIYAMNVPFEEKLDYAINGNDSYLKINWPSNPSVMSEKDLNAPRWNEFVYSLAGNKNI